ncbi:hypothetical protein [Pedobacter agri]|uniref:hypothetical protein n=1 Tax=Pedobacter agri TaxID=454586 RepID=UPI00278582DF|nr:hypothetical protein [Pedobacter agri]MDQ1140112.1 hypothetical protein [Pedobacter agri]
MKNKVTELNNKELTCFIIMPISDNENYPPGHFGRVYEYIIKPACVAAGFTPLKADDVKTTNYIAIDIIKQIVNSDMAVCDLSSQNPNVLYEVGIRQAFNLPVTFIKDAITKRIFDIQGFRDVMYDESLRIDNVEKVIGELTETIKNTYQQKNEVNSLVTLLGIEPAKISHTSISIETELILGAIKNLEYRAAVNEKSLTKQKTTFFLPELAQPAVLDNLKIGTIVYTKAFGRGKILNLEGNLPDIKATVLFENDFGTKSLLAKFAKLHVIKENVGEIL